MVKWGPDTYSVWRVEVAFGTDCEVKDCGVLRALAQLEVRVPVPNVVVHLSVAHRGFVLLDTMFCVPEIDDLNLLLAPDSMEAGHVVHVRVRLDVPEDRTASEFCFEVVDGICEVVLRFFQFPFGFHYLSEE